MSGLKLKRVKPSTPAGRRLVKDLTDALEAERAKPVDGFVINHVVRLVTYGVILAEEQAHEKGCDDCHD